MRARELIVDGGFNQRDLDFYENIFHSAWNELESSGVIGGMPREEARLTLAAIVIQLAKCCYPPNPKVLQTLAVDTFRYRQE